MGNVIRENFEFSISLTLCVLRSFDDERGVQPTICSVFGSFFIFMNLTRGNFCKKTNSAYDKKVIISVPPAQCTRSSSGPVAPDLCSLCFQFSFTFIKVGLFLPDLLKLFTV